MNILWFKKNILMYIIIHFHSSPLLWMTDFILATLSINRFPILSGWAHNTLASPPVNLHRLSAQHLQHSSNSLSRRPQDTHCIWACAALQTFWTHNTLWLCLAHTTCMVFWTITFMLVVPDSKSLVIQLFVRFRTCVTVVTRHIYIDYLCMAVRIHWQYSGHTFLLANPRLCQVPSHDIVTLSQSSGRDARSATH